MLCSHFMMILYQWLFSDYDYSVLTDDQNVEIAASEHINLTRGHEEGLTSFKYSLFT